MTAKIKHTITVLFLFSVFAIAFAAPPRVNRFTLSNGIRVVNLHVKDTNDVAIFSYLPLRLVSDAKAKVQWSHLIEHLVLRTTGPINSYLERNGQTTYHGMHLDFIGTMDNWKQGLELQAKWLSNLPFSEQDLVEELPKAMSEFDFVSKNLNTGLFAMAAWNQAFRHGETDIAMQGGIQSANLSELQKYRDQYLVQEDRVLLCIIGGVDPEILQSTVEEKFGSITLADSIQPSATVTSQKNKDLKATWDSNVTHYMETYAIPAPTHDDYPTLYVTNAILGQSIMMDAELKKLTGSIFSGADLITPEQTYLFVSAALKPGSDVEKVKQRIRLLINHFAKPENNIRVAMIATELSKYFSSPLDFEVVKKQKVLGMSETMMLGSIGLQWGLLEFQYGENLPKIAKTLADVSPEDVANVVNRYLTEEDRKTLILTPKGLE
ncbi:hypothetical protein C6497_01640 [Candidatus Poribacteria bacterium]|nr:MAG: hypothetical protein C6497_01640 [Candidatus Poribacteria bacterium]